MIYEISGKVIEVEGTKTFSSGFSKRNIIIDTKQADSKYANVLSFTAVKDNCQLLDGFHKDDEVKLKFVIDGRTWDGPKGRSYFTDLKILKIKKTSEAAGCGGGKRAPASNPPADEGEDDGMPF